MIKFKHREKRESMENIEFKIWGIPEICGQYSNQKLKGIEKIIISKSLGKKRQSPRKLASKFRSNGLRGSKDTIRRYLRKNLGVKPCHLRKIPLLTPKHFKDKLAFCRRTINWTSEDGKQVFFFWWISFWAAFHPPNPKNDVVWTQSVPKFSPKVMVWGAMSFSCLTDLHIVPQGVNIDQEYYCTCSFHVNGSYW